jgi:hypothetical protein
MKQKLLALVFLTGLIIFGGCYPDGAQYYSETDVVYTDYDDQFDFGTKKTYAIPDKIVKITKDLIEGEEPEFIDEPYNTQILNRIESNMAEMGYTKTDDAEQADLALFPAVWTNTTIYWWYDYWCWWNPYYCGWGWGWWGPSYSTQTTGTLMMALITDDENYIEPTRVWTGALNGLLSGRYDVNRVNNGIDQAFKQSPYLKTN